MREYTAPVKAITPGKHMADKPNILVVDDEQAIRQVLVAMLQSLYNVEAASSGEEAMALVTKTSFDLAVLDIHLPGMDGLQLLEAIHSQQPHIVIIMLTGQASVDSAVYTLRHGATNYLEKPVSNEKILESVKDGLAQARQERQRNAILLKARQFFTAGLEQLDEITPTQTDLAAEAEQTDGLVDPTRFVQSGPLLMDTYRRMATLNGELLDLTEYDLLLCLVKEAPRVLNPQEIVQQTRGFECSLAEAREIIRWQIYLLRQKLEIDPSSPQYILNVRGRGYMWAAV